MTVNIKYVDHGFFSAKNLPISAVVRPCASGSFSDSIGWIGHGDVNVTINMFDNIHGLCTSRNAIDNFSRDGVNLFNAHGYIAVTINIVIPITISSNQVSLLIYAHVLDRLADLCKISRDIHANFARR